MVEVVYLHSWYKKAKYVYVSLDSDKINDQFEYFVNFYNIKEYLILNVSNAFIIKFNSLWDDSR